MIRLGEFNSRCCDGGHPGAGWLKIAYTSLVQGNYEIFVMNADGSNQQQITNNPGKDDFSCWHPDGKRIFYVSEVKGKIDIYSTSVEELVDNSAQ